MSNKIVQLENESGDNLYPIAGGALTGSISKTMLEEGVFEGPELSEPSSVAYVATDNIQDNAVTSDKIDYTTLNIDLTDYKTATVTAVSRATAKTFGKLVQLNITVTTSTLSAGGTYTLFEGLPNSLRPSETTNIAGALGTKPLARAWVGSNGVIQFTNWENSTTPSVNIGCTYFAA